MAPRAVEDTGIGLDASWVLALDLSLVRHLQWGRDVAWTYGPLGVAATTEFFDLPTWLMQFGLTLAIQAVLVAALAWFLVVARAGVWTWLLAAGALALPIGILPSTDFGGQTAATAILAVAAVRRGRVAVAAAAAAGFLMALVFLIKGTALVGSAATLAVFVVWMVAVERRWMVAVVAVLALAVSFGVIWVVAGQSLVVLPGYFRSTLEIVSGYTPAMSILRESPAKHVVAQVLLGGVLVAATAASAVLGGLLRRRLLTVTALLMLPLMFVAFKEGFVRFGDRQAIFFGMAAAVQPLLVAAALHRDEPSPAPPRLIRWGAALPALLTVLASAVYLGGAAEATGAEPARLLWPVTTLNERLATYRQAWGLMTDPGARAAFRAHSISEIRSAYGLDESLLGAERNQPTDILPWDVDLVYGYGLDWDPRPVFGTYQGYTPYLDQADARHFQTPDAPRRVLISFESIDGRYPPFDEPATLRALEDNYRVVGTAGPYIRLERRDAPVSSGVSALGPTESRALGSWIEVPPGRDGRVFGSVKVPLSARGSLASLLFQPGEVHIELRLADGTVSGPYRFVPRVAEDGIDLSSLATDQNSLARLLDGKQDRPITAFRITSDQPADYSGEVSVRFLAPR